MYLIRVQNGTPDAIPVRIRLPHGLVTRACLGTVLGECAGAVDVTGDTLTVPFRAYDIKTLVVSVGAGGSDTPAVPGSRN